MKRRFDITSILMLTTVEWASRKNPLEQGELGVNTDTGELRFGPGRWDEISPASGRTSVEVVAVATSNITINTALNAGDTLDGVTLAAGDKVLVMGQSSASANGIYTVGPSPGRTTGYTTFDSLVGIVVRVKAGTSNGGKYFRTIAAAGGTINSTSIPYSELKVMAIGTSGKNQLAALNAAPALNDNMIIALEDPTTGIMVKTTLGAVKTHVAP